jgi:hypothetical protein
LDPIRIGFNLANIPGSEKQGQKTTPKRNEKSSSFEKLVVLSVTPQACQGFGNSSCRYIKKYIGSVLYKNYFLKL